MCFGFSRNFSLHFAKKGAAEPRAIGPIHRADQRTDAGTPSADQAGQNIAWTHLVAPLRVSITAVGCRFRKRLKVAQRKAHFATFHQCHGKMHQGNIWNGGIPHESLWLYGQQAQPLLSGIRPCVSKWYETVVFPVTETDFVPTIAGSRHSTLAICGPGLNGIQTFLLISLPVSHSYTRMKVSFFRYLSCRSSRPHILCLIATILPLSQIEIFTLHIWLERISSFTNLNKLSCEVRHIRWGRIGHRRDSESASRLAG